MYEIPSLHYFYLMVRQSQSTDLNDTSYTVGTLSKVFTALKYGYRGSIRSNTPTHGGSIDDNNLLSAGYDDGSKAYSNNIECPLPPLYILYPYGQHSTRFLPLVLEYRRASGRDYSGTIWEQPSNSLDLSDILGVEPELIYAPPSLRLPQGHSTIWACRVYSLASRLPFMLRICSAISRKRNLSTFKDNISPAVGYPRV